MEKDKNDTTISLTLYVEKICTKKNGTPYALRDVGHGNFKYIRKYLMFISCLSFRVYRLLYVEIIALKTNIIFLF